jgi:hypothetical protein
MYWNTLKIKKTGARNRKESLLEQRIKSNTSCPPICTEQNLCYEKSRQVIYHLKTINPSENE